MMKSIANALGLCIGALVFASQASAGGDARPQLVSLVELLATPRVYDQKLVRVVGFADFGFEASNLFLNRDDYEYQVLRNSVWLDLKGSTVEDIASLDLHRKYVMVEGVFDASYRPSLYAGAIRKVSVLKEQTRISE